MLALLFAAAPTVPAPAEAGWTNKEVLIAIGGILGAMIPVVLFIVQYVTGGLKARIRQLENEQKERPTKQEVADHRLKILDMERDIESLHIQVEDRDVKAKKACEEIEALKGNLETALTALETAESELRRLRSRVGKTLNKDGHIWKAKAGKIASEFVPLDGTSRRMPIISVMNLKGGVGKTTTTANLAAAFDASGYRTLVVDLDLQGSLTGLLLDEMEQKGLEATGTKLEDYLFASFEGKKPNLVNYVQTIFGGKSGLVATSDLLTYAETNLTNRWLLQDGRKDVRFLLRKALQHKGILKRYDIALLDCPPFLNSCCVNALAASDFLLIPVMPSRQATARIPVLLKRVKEFIGGINSNLKIVGILPNRTYGEQLTKDEQDRLSELADICLDAWGTKVPTLKTNIPQHTVIRRVEDARRLLEPGDELHETFLALAREIEGELLFFCRASGARAEAVA